MRNAHALSAGAVVLTLMSSPAVLASSGDELEVPDAAEACLSCHAVRKGGPELEGPRLWGVVGRRIASVSGYPYSDALRAVQGTWDRATLNRFLSGPQEFAPGTKMSFGGVRNAADREVVLDFLERISTPDASSSAEDERDDDDKRDDE